MNAWMVLFAIVVVAVLFVLLPVGGATLAHYWRPRRLRCPMAGSDASVQVDATGAALSELIGVRALTARACSRWPWAWGCRQQCLADERAASGRNGAASSPRAIGPRIILAALDGSAESEAVLGEVEAIARDENARVRLLHVTPIPAAVEVEDRIVAYADQETARVELLTQAYLATLARRLPGIRTEGIVRFGDPVEEIVAEAESSGADLIAMATHDWTGMARLRWGSVTDAVASATRIPVIRVACASAAPVNGRLFEATR
jgi:universal stress protein A